MAVVWSDVVGWRSERIGYVTLLLVFDVRQVGSGDFSSRWQRISYDALDLILE